MTDIDTLRELLRQSGIQFKEIHDLSGYPFYITEKRNGACPRGKATSFYRWGIKFDANGGLSDTWGCRFGPKELIPTFEILSSSQEESDVKNETEIELFLHEEDNSVFEKSSLMKPGESKFYLLRSQAIGKLHTILEPVLTNEIVLASVNDGRETVWKGQHGTSDLKELHIPAIDIGGPFLFEIKNLSDVKRKINNPTFLMKDPESRKDFIVGAEQTKPPLTTKEKKIPSHSKMVFTAMSGHAMKVLRLQIESAQIDSLVVLNVLIGKNSQFLNGNAIPAAAFNKADNLSFDTIQRGMYASAVIENQGDEETTISVSMYGSSKQYEATLERLS